MRNLSIVLGVIILFILSCSKSSIQEDVNENLIENNNQQFERKTAVGGPPNNPGDDEIGGCSCGKVDWKDCLTCGNSCGGCCVRIRSAYPPPYEYRFECRYMGPGFGGTGGHDYPTIGIDLTAAEVGYDNFSLTRTINGGTSVTLETHTSNPSSTIDVLKYYDDSTSLPNDWETKTITYTFKLFNAANVLIATEEWVYNP